jgi:hypothetical protein
VHGRFVRVAWLFFAAFVACGYGVGATRAISVGKLVDAQAIDVDAAALVTNAVRRAVARGPRTRLVESDAADAHLEVELLSTDSPLAPFADPAARAAQYRATVTVRGRLVDRGGKIVWTSNAITGEARYLSVSGAVEALEGARRRALERAAEDAAERLLAGMDWREGKTTD